MSTIFKDMNAFEQCHVPKDFMHREGELREIAFCLEPAFKGYQATSVKIYGEPATGKTTAVKIVFEEIKDKSSVACAYVNSSIYDTRFSIFYRIHQNLRMGSTARNFDGIYEHIMNKLKREKKSLIVAIDDVNFLDAQTLNEVLISLLKAGEEYSVYTSVIAISSSPSFSLYLRPQVASVFSPREIFFRPYSFEEMYDILKQRCCYGFVPGAVGEEAVWRIAGIAFREKDLRLGIRLLKESGVIAEMDGCKITEEHVEKALVSMPASTLKVRSLSREELEILEFVCERGQTTTGDILRRFEKHGVTIWRKIKKLSKLGLVKTEVVHRAGRTTKITCNVSKEELMRCMQK